MSGDESRLAGNPLWLTAQWTGRGSPWDALLTWLLIANGRNQLQWYNFFSTACFFFFVSFSICGFKVQGRNLLVSQRAEQWKPGTHLKRALFASILRARALVWGLPRRETTREKGNLYLKHQEKKEQSKIYVFLPLLFVSTFSFCLFLFFMACFRWQQGRSSSCCTSEGSSGPSRSSRRCPASSGAAAWEEGSGSICRLGWSGRSYWTTSHLGRQRTISG